ncbi:synaptonemal complex protein 1-like [Quillaja saponaria]|uniref:Synaptonemal complex protein 1-like n=1 Tax=Quillaja saponaria TaxID=32244 RepID=A0AAD7PLE0_QUISA|nr:synaptonemal complex protein 1-like [Quillaja saponaria]
MQKLGFPSSKSLEQFKSLCGSASGAPKAFSFSSRPSTESISSGSFANLKLTAEKLVKEQASVKTDLEIVNAKLKKSTEHIHALEEKLQNAFNENAKLKVKQREDEKLWKGLESKFSSTKTLCDQITETLQQLASLVQASEKDKELFEEKLSASSEDLDGLNQQMNGLSLKLNSAEESIRISTKELEELKVERDQKDRFYRDEQNKAANLIQQKDAMIEKFEENIAANKLAIEDLNSKLGEMHLQLKLKEEEITNYITTEESLKKEKRDLQLANCEFDKKLDKSLQEIKDLEGLVHAFAAKLVELDKQSLTFWNRFDHLKSLCDTYFKLVLQERDMASKHAQNQYDELHKKKLCIESEKDALHSINQELKNTVTECQKVQESTIAQLSEEHRLAAERIQKLESEAEILVSKKTETQLLVSKLEENIDTLSESLRSSENQVQDLLRNFSALEFENKDNTAKLQAVIQKKSEEIDTFQKENVKHDLHVDSLEKQVSQLNIVLQEKDQLILLSEDREKKLEDQITENQALLTASESKLMEAKKQYDLMVENKQLELSRHLKEISQRNDQAINEIRRKYEVEKLEIVNMEKEKADKAVAEIERKYDLKLAECKEESRQSLMRIQEEHAAMVTQIQQEHERKRLSLISGHNEALKRTQMQAEDDLREKTVSLRNEHEAQIKALTCQQEDECRKLQDELHLQKSKEDRQRALLQLQWKVMSDKPKEDQEVNSRKDYSMSSIKRSSGVGKRSQQALDSPLLEVTQTPVSRMLKKVQNVNTGSVMSIPKHHKKVTHHEYEVETSNGRTITKRRKTRSTVMFEDPSKHKIKTPEANTPGSVVKGVKKGEKTNPSNMGDLFTEGSLNPYADDPYAFD